MTRSNLVCAVMLMVAPISSLVAATTFPGFNEPDAIASDGVHLWVVNQGGANNGSVVEFSQTGTVLRTVALTGMGQYLTGIAYDGNDHVWVGSANGTVIEIDTLNGVIENAVAVGASPFGVTYDGQGGIWVACEGSQTVTKVSVALGTVLGTFSTPSHSPFLMAVDASGQIWVTAEQKTVYVFNIATGALVQTISVNSSGFSSPTGIAFDGTDMWVADTYFNEVYKLTDAGSIVATVTLAAGSKPQGLAFAAGYIWAADFGTNNVSVISTTTDKVVETVAVGNEPIGITAVGSYVWTANNTGNSVTRIKD